MDYQQLNLEYAKLLATFENIRLEPSRLKQRYLLNFVANYHGLPKSECRQLFQLFLIEKNQRGDKS